MTAQEAYPDELLIAPLFDTTPMNPPISEQIDKARRACLVGGGALVVSSVLSSCKSCKSPFSPKKAALPPLQRPHSSMDHHPLKKFAEDLSPKRKCFVIDYPGLVEKLPENEIFELSYKMMSEKTQIKPHLFKYAKKTLEGVIKFKTSGTLSFRNKKNEDVRVIIIGPMDDDPIRFSATSLNLQEETLREANFKLPVSVSDIQGIYRMHELGHVVNPDEVVADKDAKLLTFPEGEILAHRHEMFADVFASLIVLRDTGNTDAVQFLRAKRLIRAFNGADHWDPNKGPNMAWADSVIYLTDRGISEALKRFDDGKLAGASDQQILELAEEITGQHSYIFKELETISNELIDARVHLGNEPNERWYGLNLVIEGNKSEKYKERCRFFKAVQEGLLKKSNSYVQPMIEAHRWVLGHGQGILSGSCKNSDKSGK